VDGDGKPGLTGPGPECVVHVLGIQGAVGERRDDGPAVAILHGEVELGERVLDAGRRNDRLGDETPARTLAEAADPLVVGTHAGQLQLPLARVDPGTLEGDGGIQHLGVDAVGVHVPQARLGIEAPGSHALVGLPHRSELEVALARGRGQTHGPGLATPVEMPDVTLLGVDELRGPVLPLPRYGVLPQVRRLVDVRVGVQDRIVDAGDVGEEVALGVGHGTSG
jgi:hypothetical protein